MLEAEGVDDRRGHRRAGHLVDRAHHHRAVEPRRARRRWPTATTPGYVAAAITVARARAGRRARPADGRHRRAGRAASQPGQRGGGASGAHRRPAPHRRRGARRRRSPARATVRGAGTGRGSHHRRPVAGPLRAGAFDDSVVDLVERVAREQGRSTRRMPSGAGHDAQMLARVLPGGHGVRARAPAAISHNPAEHTDDDQLAAGADVLLAGHARSSPAGIVVSRKLTVAAAQMGPIARDESPAARGRAPHRAAARGRGPRRRSRGVSRSWRSRRSSRVGISTTTSC